MIESLINIDETLFNFINSDLSCLLFDVILVPIRHKFFWIPLYLFISAFILLNFAKTKWLIFFTIGLCICLSDTTSSKIIKTNVQRIRPCHVQELNPVTRVPCSIGYSFTSSHATNHFALGIFFFSLFSFSKWRWFFIFWAGLIGFSQIYVGVHYPLDVLVGSLIGALIGWSCFKIFKLLEVKFYS